MKERLQKKMNVKNCLVT